MTRCKNGDLAIVVREFEGCEGNLGKLVLVVGNPRQTKNWGIVWKIRPAADSGWWIIPRTGDTLTGKAKYCEDYLAYLHSDEWLFPIKAEPTAITATETTHTPKLEKV